VHSLHTDAVLRAGCTLWHVDAGCVPRDTPSRAVRAVQPGALKCGAATAAVCVCVGGGGGPGKGLWGFIRTAPPNPAFF
jgi:hypothetical protein